MKIRNEGIINYVALVFFIVCWIVFSLFLRFLDSANLTFSFFKYISQYITITLGIILIFKDLHGLFPFAKADQLVSKAKNFINRRSGKEEEISVSVENLEKSEPELQKIRRTNLEADNESQDRKNGAGVQSRLEIFAYGVFMAAHALNGYFFLAKIFFDGYYNKNLPGGYIVISAFAILSIIAFVIRKLLSIKEGYTYNTVVDYCMFFGPLLLVGVFFLTIKIVFSLEYTVWLVWILKIASVYIVASLGFSILMSLLKKEARKFDYQIYIPFINGKGYSVKSFVEVFEKNTNISIKSLWSFEYLLTTFPAFILSIALILSMATCFYKIESYEEAAVYRFGKLNENSIKGEGLHVKLPWPIEKLEVYSVKREKGLQIGYKTTSTGDFLWAVPHDGGEYTLVLGNGNELVAINARVNYCIDDLYLYLTNYQNPEVLLSDVSYELLTNKTITKNLNDFLMEDRTRLSEELKKNLIAYSQAKGLGLEVKNVVIQSIHPAVEVADVYQGVVGAGIEKQSLIIKAETEASKLIAEAEKAREGTIMAAMQNQTEKLSMTEYELAVYEAAYEAYKLNKNSFKLDKYLQTYEKIIENNKLYIFSPKAAKNMQNYVINRGGKDNEQAIIIN